MNILPKLAGLTLALTIHLAAPRAVAQFVNNLPDVGRISGIPDRPIEFDPDPPVDPTVMFTPYQITSWEFLIPTNPVVFVPDAVADPRIIKQARPKSDDSDPEADFPPLLNYQEQYPLTGTNAVLFQYFTSPMPGGEGPGDFAPSSPAPTTNFVGLLETDYIAVSGGWTKAPPDTYGSVGPSNLITMLNTQVRIHTYGGTEVATTTLSNFWRNTLVSADIFDPRVVYDAGANRWIATALANRNTTNSHLLIGVAPGNTPAFTNWSLGKIKIDTQATNFLWADYPNVGFNRDWAAISVSLAITTNSLSKSRIYIFNKTSLYSGVLSYTSYTIEASDYGLNQVPAITYDTNQATLYLLQSGNGSFTNNPGTTNQTVKGVLLIYTISGSVSSPGLALTTTLTNLPAAAPWAQSPPTNTPDVALQKDLNIPINTGDSRMQSVLFRNGRIWGTHTIHLPYTNATRAAVQWWSLSPGGNVGLQALLDSTSGTSYAFPSIAVNRFGDALIGYSRFSTNEYASGCYSYRNFYEASNALFDPYVYKAGLGPYYKRETSGSQRNRWGDFSATVVDPRNDADFWTIQEFADTPTGNGQSSGNGRWGTWWAQVSVTFPTNDAFASAISISGTEGSTEGTTVRATRQPGEPNHAGNANTPSVWYYWSCPTNGTVMFDTIGSTFDTVLAVYTGSAVGSLTLVASDNDSGGGGASKLTFSATAGTTYRIAVAGWNGAAGSLVLNWNLPPPPVFATQPGGVTVIQPASFSLVSEAVSQLGVNYQWRKNGTNITGATSATYTKASTTTNDSGNYTVLAANANGAVTSQVAVVTVLRPETATLSGPVVTNSQFNFSVSGLSGSSYIVQANTNLSTTNWVAVSTNTSPFTFTEGTLTNYPQRFYRAVWKP